MKQHWLVGLTTVALALPLAFRSPGAAIAVEARTSGLCVRPRSR